MIILKTDGKKDLNRLKQIKKIENGLKQLKTD